MCGLLDFIENEWDHLPNEEEIFNLEEADKYDLPFENLVLEGGGVKGMGYVGVLQVREEVGIAKQITRICGASVGAITASLLAVGYNSKDLKEFLDTDLRKILIDHKCGYFSILPNMLRGFGWNPGEKLLEWFGDQLRERTGKADITFNEVLEGYGRELCIVVTNLSHMSTEYFHPKTTPNTPIRIAVRMSIALPGVFQSFRHCQNGENVDVYVDGGLLCNYPIHAFDGWWLSMEKQDSFFRRLQPLDNYAHFFSKNERFGTWNDKTLGIMLYSNTETELMKSRLATRPGNEPPIPPQSKLFKTREAIRQKEEKATKDHQHIVDALSRFLQEIHKREYDLDGVVSEDELRELFQKAESFTKEDQELLFGSHDACEALKALDLNGDKKITFEELIVFAEKKGIDIQTKFLGYKRKEITSLMEFLMTIQTALSVNVKRNYVDDRDIERTIGIDTDYIEANDFDMEKEDKDFLIECGRRAARAFLRHYCSKKTTKAKDENHDL